MGALNSNDFSIFCGYLYNDSIKKVQGRDGIPISSFMSDDLAFDLAKIDLEKDTLVIKYGVDIIEEIPMKFVKSKYAKIQKIY